MASDTPSQPFGEHDTSSVTKHASSNAVAEKEEKCSTYRDEVERGDLDDAGNIVYDLAEEEPEIHLRTYLAVASMILINFVQVLALQGPPTVLSYIGKNLGHAEAQTWVPNVLSLVQAVLTPLISSASDVFQTRKQIMVVSYVVSFLGSGIAAGSKNMYMLIGGQAVIGVGFSSVALVYTVPSEILPRRWRPMAQASINFAASTGACVGPLIIGALTKRDPENGWRDFFWIEMALWGLAAVGIFFGYRPLPRHTRLDHLSFWQKLGHIDIAGGAMLAAALTLTLTALNLGGGLYAWTSARVLATLCIGIVGLAVFGLYEWRGTSIGILHHGLFQGGRDAGRTFALCVLLIFLENFVGFSYIVFYPSMTNALFEQDPFLLAARCISFWLGSGASTLLWGYWSTKFRTVRDPMFAGFLIFTGGVIGLATIQPDDSLNSIIFATLAGIGFGAPLVLVVAGVHLSVPHDLIATATGLTCSTRAVAATVSTAIYAAVLTNRLNSDLPSYTTKAALAAGLPASSLGAFLKDLLSGDISALSSIDHVTPAIIRAAQRAMLQAYADGFRTVYIIAAPFGAVACVVSLFLGNLKKVMTFRVDAPVEKLHAKAEARRDDVKV